MARFHDKVGFLIPMDDQTTGIASNKAVERPCYGTVLEHSRRWNSGDNKNDDLTLDVQIEITANPFIREHIKDIAYVHYLGGYWKVESFKPAFPNIILNIGGVWNGETAASAAASHACT